MPRSHLRRTARSLHTYVADADSVPLSRRLPSARTIGLCVGAGRVAIGAVFLAAPVTSVRLLGLDTATAARITWLARMTAVRDTVLGAGTVASWLEAATWTPIENHETRRCTTAKDSMR